MGITYVEVFSGINVPRGLHNQLRRWPTNEEVGAATVRSWTSLCGEG
jgi:hypothetical protein